MKTISGYPYCYKVLPLSYDDSLSYYEQLCKLVSKMNEIIEEVNSIDPDNLLSTINKDVQEQIDRYMETITKQMDNLSAQVGGVMDNVDNALELYQKQVTLELANTTANLTNFVNTQLAQLKIYVDTQDRSIMSELRYQIELLKNSLPDLNTVYVVSPYTGKTVNIQTAIDELWEYMRVNSLTASEYDSLMLTADEYDDYELTAYQYDFSARKYIWKDSDAYMFHPWTGEWDKISSVVSFVTSVVRQLNLSTIGPMKSNHGYMASYYDGIRATATKYDALNIPAQKYDWDAAYQLRNVNN